VHKRDMGGVMEDMDLGQVGDVANVNTKLILLLLQNDFIPVICCFAADQSGIGHNINGDMFAGHIAGALNAERYIILTDVDGLLRDKDDPTSLIDLLTVSETKQLLDDQIIQGGMIPKIQSCEIAIMTGAKSASIINGTVPDQVLSCMDHGNVGTRIVN
jgi:acetylglutamate kinase